jgi:protein-S-isoprenylcysteine O-methyltransferase Ste14
LFDILPFAFSMARPRAPPYNYDMKFLIPPLLAAICLALMFLLRWAWPITVFLTPPWTYLGFVLLTAGLALPVAGSRHFKKAGTTHKPFHEAKKLVTTGIYRYTRNPMYLGLTLLLTGACLLLAALSTLIPLLFFIAAADRWYIRGEEKMLAKKFGQQFQEYKARTRRWI